MSAPHERLPVRAMIADAAAMFGVSALDIISTRRTAPIVEARFAAVWTARTATSYSLPKIGRAFGDRDHGTILNAVRRAEQRRASDPLFLARTNELLRLAEERNPTQ